MQEKWILRHCDLDLCPKVTNFNRVRATAISNYLAKTASKLVHSFGWNFVHKKRARHTDTQTHTLTNWSENITPPRFRGGVINSGGLVKTEYVILSLIVHRLENMLNCLESIAVVAIVLYDFIYFFITPPRNRGGVIFSLQFVCLSVCVCVSVCLSVYLELFAN